MKDIYLQLFRTRHDYHDTKERMVWLATTLYLGFAFAAIDWISKNGSKWITLHFGWTLWFGVAAVFLCALVFACVQNWYKASTVMITGKLTKLLDSFKGRKEPTSAELQRALNVIGEMDCCKKIGVFFSCGKAGLIGILLMIWNVRYSDCACLRTVPHLESQKENPRLLARAGC